MEIRVIKSLIVGMMCMTLLLTACAGETIEPTATLTGALDTQIAQTVRAQATLTAQSFTPTSVPVTLTRAPSRTPLPDTPTPTTVVVLKPTVSIFSAGQTMFRDDFETEAGWFTKATNDYSVEFVEGGYRIFVDMVTGASPVYSVREFEFKDIQIEVDVMRNDGPDSSYFGLVCRFMDGNNYYSFTLFTDGSYEIGKKVDGIYTSLEHDSEVSLLKPNDAPNHISATCIGSILTLYVNDKKVNNVLDTSLHSGYIGLIAGTNKEPSLDVLFDNFTVSQP